jgi:hypothetical protein
MLISVFRYALEDPIIGETNAHSMHRSLLKSDPGNSGSFSSWYHRGLHNPGKTT